MIAMNSMPIVAAIIAALVGGIASGLLVYWLTRSREREASMRDFETDEWRELLSALTKIQLYEAASSDANRVLKGPIL